jgi:hypothetical protein
VKKIAHITRNGQPLCKCEMHGAGLLGYSSPILSKPWAQSCSFKSITEARRALNEMRPHASGLRLVVGKCPAFESE